jgi:hypothetical protein
MVAEVGAAELFLLPQLVVAEAVELVELARRL